MSRKIKLIWDFIGEDSFETAKHHCKHLQEFAEKEKLTYHKIDVVKLNDFKAIAFITVDEVDMLTFRDALKPHRGELG